MNHCIPRSPGIYNPGLQPHFLFTTQSIVNRKNRPVEYSRQIQAALGVVMKGWTRLMGAIG